MLGRDTDFDWCTDVRIISRGCTPDLEYLTLKCRPFYMPREFSSVTLTAGYIHPKANVVSAMNDFHEVINKYENSDTLSIVLGGFDQGNLRTVLPNFRHHVTCPTQGQILDHCYCSFKSAYKSVARANFGNSAHSTVLLIPSYKQELKRSKPVQFQTVSSSSRP